MRNLKIYIAFFLPLIYISSCEENVEIHTETQKILASLDDKIYLNIYMSGNLSPQFQQLKASLKSMLGIFQNYSNKDIDFDFVNIEEVDSSQINNRIYNPLWNLNMHPIWIKHESNYFKTYPYAMVNFKEMSLPVLLYNSIYYDTIPELSANNLQNAINELEYKIIESIYLLKQNKKKKIAFLQGNGELDSTNTWDIRNTLSQFYAVENFDLRSFELDPISHTPDINRQIERLNEYEAIIIANPKETFLELDKYLIDQYIMHGGKTMWLLDGTTANMNNFGEENEFHLEKDSLLLNQYLLNYGIKVNHNLIQDQKCTKSPIVYNNEVAYINWPYNPKLINNKNHIINSSQDSILTNFVSSIEILSPEKTTILLSSSKNSNVLNQGESVNLDIIRDPPDRFEGEQIVGVLLEDEFISAFSYIDKEEMPSIKKKSKKNNMIIISDGDIISNLYTPPNFYHPLGYYHYGKNVFDGNTNFILNAVQFLCNDESLIKIKYKK